MALQQQQQKPSMGHMRLLFPTALMFWVSFSSLRMPKQNGAQNEFLRGFTGNHYDWLYARGAFGRPWPAVAPMAACGRLWPP